MIIVLLTDFGESEYVGMVKGVILNICPSVKIVDLTHNIEKYNIRHASFILEKSYPYFPKGSIFLAVVDPGVGTKREGIIIKTKEYIFIGPNNGIFGFLKNVERAIRIKMNMKNVSSTFHARDVFAPIAAKIACGSKIEKFGDEKIKIVKIDQSPPEKLGKKIVGEVLYTDSFGNIITNIPKSMLPYTPGEKLILKIGDKKYATKFVKSYGFANIGELVLVIGSSDMLEIAINQGNAKKNLKVKGGEKIEVEKCEDCS